MMDEGFMPEDVLPEDQVFYAVVIENVGPSKIGFVKLLRQVTQLDLKAAKDIAETPTPFVLVICDALRALAFQKAAAEVGAVCKLTDYDETTKPVIGDDQPFGLDGAAQGGCAANACMLIAVGGGAIYGLVSLLGYC